MPRVRCHAGPPGPWCRCVDLVHGDGGADAEARRLREDVRADRSQPAAYCVPSAPAPTVGTTGHRRRRPHVEPQRPPSCLVGGVLGERRADPIALYSGDVVRTVRSADPAPHARRHRPPGHAVVPDHAARESGPRQCGREHLPGDVRVLHDLAPGWRRRRGRRAR